MSDVSLRQLVVLFLATILFVAGTHAQDAADGPLTFEVTLQPESPEVGQRATLVITPPAGLEVESLEGRMQGLRIGSYEKQPDGSFVATVYPMTTGTFGLEEMNLRARLAGGDTIAAALSPLSFTVPDPAELESPPEDYSGLFAAERTLWTYLLAGTVALLIAASVLLLLALLVRRWWSKRAAIAALPTPLPDPIDEAFQSLSSLESLEEYHTHGTKAHYASLSMLLRRYIEREWHRPAMEMSEDEVTGMLRAEFSHRPGVSDLLRLLATASLAKFARLEVAINDVQSHLSSARAFLTSERDRLRAAVMAQNAATRQSGGREAA